MNKLLAYNPEPFAEMNEWAGEEESGMAAEAWAMEGEIGGKRRSAFRGGGLRAARTRPSVATFRKGGQRLRPTGSLRPGFVRPDTKPKRPPLGKMRIPYIPPVIGVMPLPSIPPNTTTKDTNTPDNQWRTDAGSGSASPQPTPDQTPQDIPPSEHIRWVQDCLNQALGLRLMVDGIMNRETRSAVRLFQERQGLRISGLVGPDTEELLKTTCRDDPVNSESEAGLCPLFNGRETMNDPFNYQTEFLWETLPFSYEGEFEREVLGGLKSSDYIRWAQSSLNKILRLNLKIDGVVGPKTRSAIRSFQQKQGLVATGDLDGRTENALRYFSSTHLQVKPCANWKDRNYLISGYKKDQYGFHSGMIGLYRDLLQKIVESFENGCKPIYMIEITGYASREGSDQYNFNLGLRRARRLQEMLSRDIPIELKNRSLENKIPLAKEIIYKTYSNGSRNAKDACDLSMGCSDEIDAKFRKVEVSLQRLWFVK